MVECTKRNFEQVVGYIPPRLDFQKIFIGQGSTEKFLKISDISLTHHPEKIA